MNATRPGRQRGLTLIELMFAITVLAILLGIGAPSFVDFVRDNRVTALTNDLVTATALARSEASKRGLPVSVCPSANAVACSGATDWAVGWIVFTDTGVAGAVDGTDEILQVADAAPAGYSLTGVTRFFRFAPNGLTEPALVNAPTPNPIDVRKTGCTGQRARQISVFRAGRVAATRVNC